jgi:hypothetical protein
VLLMLSTSMDWPATASAFSCTVGGAEIAETRRLLKAEAVGELDQAYCGAVMNPQKPP